MRYLSSQAEKDPNNGGDQRDERFRVRRHREPLPPQQRRLFQRRHVALLRREQQLGEHRGHVEQAAVGEPEEHQARGRLPRGLRTGRDRFRPCFRHRFQVELINFTETAGL